jgi:hypothetical protein
VDLNRHINRLDAPKRDGMNLCVHPNLPNSLSKRMGYRVCRQTTFSTSILEKTIIYRSAVSSFTIIYRHNVDCDIGPVASAKFSCLAGRKSDRFISFMPRYALVITSGPTGAPPSTCI